jgi:hypothetical protein
MKVFREIMIVILFTAVLAEVSVRLLLTYPYQIEPSKLEVYPEFYIIGDSILGLKHKEGKYTLVFNDSIKTSVEIDALGNRVCHAPARDTNREIYFYGCSFTFGYGTDDSSSFPFLLSQQLHDSVLVRNYALGGIGTIHSLLQLQTISKTENATTAILMYADFHRPRNTLSNNWRVSNYLRALLTSDEPGNRMLPYGFLKDGHLKIGYKNFLYGSKILAMLMKSHVFAPVSYTHLRAHET